METEALKLFYDEKAFSEDGLKIEVKEIVGAVWHYGQALCDLKGTYRTLDRCDGDAFINSDKSKKKIELGTGIISREGFSVIDDSRSMALTEDGWVAPRKKGTDLYFFGYGHRYLDALADFYRLCFQYTQAGQENSFGWQKMQKGIEHQFPLIGKMAKEGKVSVMTLCESGRYFKERFDTTPPRNSCSNRLLARPRLKLRMVLQQILQSKSDTR